MKPFLALVLTTLMTFVLSGCGEKSNEEKAADAWDSAKEKSGKLFEDAKDAVND
ncbi:MAG: hypothetical protein R3302_02850 [Sulfurimonadaceae bacterium]|nr:hypothetical protein [Sulfurimonadaceae bacterium]